MTYGSKIGAVLLIAGAFADATVPAGEDWFSFFRQAGPLGVLCVVVAMFLRHLEKRDDIQQKNTATRDADWRAYDKERSDRWASDLSALRKAIDHKEVDE